MCYYDKSECRDLVCYIFVNNCYLEEVVIKEAPVKVNAYILNKERKAAIRKKQNELKRCEQEIENTELQIAEIEEMLSDIEIASDYNKTIELSQNLQTLKDKDEELMILWEELNEWLMENTDKEED